MKYRFIDDLTSDVMFEAYGKTPKELFSNAALALFSVICQIKDVKPTKVKVIEVGAKNLKDLMFEWLQELIGIVDTENLFFSKFEILEIDDKHLKAKCWGEEASPERGGTVVKAVTYYKYKFEKTKEGYKVRVSLDI
jgi:SHS2 domain-containing protein